MEGPVTRLQQLACEFEDARAAWVAGSGSLETFEEAKTALAYCAAREAIASITEQDIEPLPFALELVA